MKIGIYAENNTGFTYWLGFILGLVDWVVVRQELDNINYPFAAINFRIYTIGSALINYYIARIKIH
ncbi:MAG: hypothetical protein EOO90_20075 [Pedobacter sp.]|nr:MAG: hypothetical protein EOO90_20075 [Pedobacter sp.]